MIQVRDLITWAKLNAVGSGLTCPDGWISGEDLAALAEAVIERAPFDYIPSYEDENKTEEEDVV